MDDLLRQIFRKDAPKRVSRLMNVPIETARHWVYRNVSNARRRELAEKLLEQIAEDRRRWDEIERQLREIAGEK